LQKTKEGELTNEKNIHTQEVYSLIHLKFPINADIKNIDIEQK
jgi:hypothetical protein